VGRSKRFRAALTLLLEDTEFTVATGVDSLAELSRINGPFRRDQMVLLVKKPDDLLQLSSHIEMLKARLIPPWIVFLARTLDTIDMTDSFACGVDGYLLEKISPQALTKSLKLVTLGVKVFPSQIVTLMIASHLRNSHDKGSHAPYGGVLSDREAEVVTWLMVGTPNKVIAWHMSIAETTVKVHVKNILKKVGVVGRTQLAIWAMQEGMSPARPCNN
jgi:two-component system nitrate/nitrite response regulator NarL